MDFSFTEEQQAVSELADKIFTGVATVDRVKEVERSADRFDRDLWGQLASANLLGIALPEEHGGSGLGLTELCLVLEQQGRRVAPVPLLWTQVAALALAAHGSPELAAEWVPGVATGDVVLTLALAEAGAGDPLQPWAVARSSTGGWTIDGTKLSVPYAHVAARVLTTARVDGTDEVVLLLVDPSSAASSQTGEATDHQLLTHLTFDSAPATLVAPGTGAVQWTVERALTGLAAIQLGVAEEALTQAAAYTSNRIQFGKPLSSFQSTSARAADAYIDTEAIRATLWQAAWRLDTGLPASLEVEVATWWAAEAGQRVVHATQHLHGGMGADIEYPIHRYFLWGKQIEDTLGGASNHLARIGKGLAAQ
jgi:alkylation response protein AidB-like acyl-CoA dehydrogenase